MALRGGRTYYGDTSPGRRSATKRYPTTPPPLNRDEIQGFDARRRVASRGWQEALAHRQRGRGRETARFNQFENRLKRDSDRQGMEARSDYGARGLAFSPMGLGKKFSSIRDVASDDLGKERASMADRLAVLNEEVNRARQSRDQEMAAVGSDEARRRTDLGKLIQMIGL